jgi:hypothetical protein
VSQTNLFHWLTHHWCNNSRSKFVKNSKQLVTTQTSILNNILYSTHDAPAQMEFGLTLKDNWCSFAKKVPITDYTNWRRWINPSHVNQPSSLCSSPTQRHQPTSGSTSAIKWIPYSRRFLSEINAALLPWMSEIYATYPETRSGHHYWSVSWIPTGLRGEVNENINDDLKVLPWWERWFVAQYMAVPETVAHAETSDDTLFASLAWLVKRSDLSFISVWSPTFALTLIQKIKVYREELIEVLTRGDWLSRTKSLRFTPCPKDPSRAALLRQTNDFTESGFLTELWPKLSLISCWDTSSSKNSAVKLQKYFPRARMEGKGLWATEGVVTIPFSGKYPLAVNSHYYEFLDIDSGIVVPSWKLEKGMNVSPILTTGSGFLRYKLDDRLLVSEFFNETPCFEFLGRIDGTDMAGEKISSQAAQSIIELFSNKRNLNPITLLAIPGAFDSKDKVREKGRYILLCELTAEHIDTNESSTFLENSLSKYFHYKLARELNQLDSARVVVTDRAFEIYQYRCEQRGMSQGNIKIEPLVLWDTELHPVLQSNLTFHNKEN